MTAELIRRFIGLGAGVCEGATRVLKSYIDWHRRGDAVQTSSGCVDIRFAFQTRKQDTNSARKIKAPR